MNIQRALVLFPAIAYFGHKPNRHRQMGRVRHIMSFQQKILAFPLGSASGAPPYRRRLPSLWPLLPALSLPLTSLGLDNPTAQDRGAQKAEWAKLAPSRAGFQVRGLGLGLSLPETERLFQAKIARIEPERKPDWQPPAFAPYQETLHLTDGAQFNLSFASPLSAGLCAVVMYEQRLRDGPTPDQLLADLESKYGRPDERGASGWWLTWHMKSRAPSADGLGAFLKVHFRTDSSGKVEYFRAVLNDYEFLKQDEQAAAQARREAERDQEEGRRSNRLQF